ncbi:cycloinulo-oligosaccharide fructanotransferase [Firmicutes bacterium CAG:449]|nr:cycloinulo-oligosaccharide fructanotransferase [Firmicutes bacterium CAG:449]
MATYQVDLSNYLNRKIKIRLVDNATADWGLLFADDFITYYESNDDLPSSFEAINII